MKWIKQANNFHDNVVEINKILNPQIQNPICREVTFQVTDECNCACTYCYQINKGKRYMTFNIGKKIVDMLFDMYRKDDENSFINKNTVGLILSFIGGEPLLNIDVADQICEYFYKRCIDENHPWKDFWCSSFSSNGALYFSNKFQTFLQKYTNHCSYSITVDGPQEIHDSCRIYKDGSGGNFKDAYTALIHYKKNYNSQPGTKITISAENLSKLNTIAKFFLDNDINTIHGNVVFEHNWTINEGKKFYNQLKLIADYILPLDKSLYISFFEYDRFCPLEPTDNKNWCGGDGSMLAFDPDGIAYPCIRYMESSLGDSRKPLIIGNYNDGIYKTEEQLALKASLAAITRRSQSTDECFNCCIAGGCAWCSGWNYQETGSFNCRSTRICNSHKARSLANVYFWNKYYLQENIPKYFHRYLSDKETLKFISKEELELLNTLETQAKNRQNVVGSNTT